MDETARVQGREITQDDIELVRRLIEADPSRNRSRFSQELCLLWNWRTANGQINDMACRTLLLKLDISLSLSARLLSSFIELQNKVAIELKKPRLNLGTTITFLISTIKS